MLTLRQEKQVLAQAVEYIRRVIHLTDNAHWRTLLGYVDNREVTVYLQRHHVRRRPAGRKHEGTYVGLYYSSGRDIYLDVQQLETPEEVAAVLMHELQHHYNAAHSPLEFVRNDPIEDEMYAMQEEDCFRALGECRPPLTRLYRKEVRDTMVT